MFSLPAGNLTHDAHASQNDGMTEMPQGAPEDVPEWTIGWRLQRSLAHAGIAAGDMAADLDVSRATVSRWLNDKGMPPRSVYMREWADRTGVSYEWLCHGDTSPCSRRPRGVPSGSIARKSNYMHFFAEMAELRVVA